MNCPNILVVITKAGGFTQMHILKKEKGRNTFYLRLQNEQQTGLCIGQVAAEWGQVHEPESVFPEWPAANNTEQLEHLLSSNFKNPGLSSISTAQQLTNQWSTQNL